MRGSVETPATDGERVERRHWSSAGGDTELSRLRWVTGQSPAAPVDTSADVPPPAPIRTPADARSLAASAPGLASWKHWRFRTKRIKSHDRIFLTGGGMGGALGFLGSVHLRWRGFDPLVRTMIANWIGGMMVGILCASLLLAFDVLGVGALLWSSESFVVGAVTLFASFAFTFGGVVCAAAVMNFDAGEDVSRRGRRPRPRSKISLGPLLSTFRGR